MLRVAKNPMIQPVLKVGNSTKFNPSHLNALQDFIKLPLALSEALVLLKQEWESYAKHDYFHVRNTIHLIGPH